MSGLDAWYDESHILHDISVSVPSSGRIAILGRNGAGKTTLLKSIMAGGPRVRGRVSWNGRTLDGLQSFRRVRMGIAIVPEDRRIFQHMTVAENIEMARYATSPARPAIPAAEILGRFTLLSSLAGRYGGQLSGGQQQMLALARAVAANPRLLLIDEPAEGLAPVVIEQLARDLRALCDEQEIALLVSEQNIWFARQCTTHVYIVETGRIVYYGDWDDFDRNLPDLQRHLAI